MDDLASRGSDIREKAVLDYGVFVLLHTGWSKHWRSDKYYDHPYLDPNAAKKLLELGAEGIGVDTLSPDETRLDCTSPNFGVHEVVLGSGMIIAENLANLKDIQTGDWLVNLVPLRLDECDGSPVRAFAWSESTTRPPLQ